MEEDLDIEREWDMAQTCIINSDEYIDMKNYFDKCIFFNVSSTKVLFKSVNDISEYISNHQKGIATASDTMALINYTIETTSAFKIALCEPRVPPPYMTQETRKNDFVRRFVKRLDQARLHKTDDVDRLSRVTNELAILKNDIVKLKAIAIQNST